MGFKVSGSYVCGLLIALLLPVLPASRHLGDSLGSVEASTELACQDKEKNAAPDDRWEADIRELEKLDQSEKHPQDSILFVGSSSVRLWNHIEKDMAPYHPIKRGFGGSRLPDVVQYSDRLIAPHSFAAICIFVANDIRGREDDNTPAEVIQLFSKLHSKIRKLAPKRPIFYIAVTPTKARAGVWQAVKQGNDGIRKLCHETPNTFFIGTESIFLDSNQEPNSQLFLKDGLHLNEAGYKLWAAAIKSHLDSVIGHPPSAQK